MSKDWGGNGGRSGYRDSHRDSNRDRDRSRDNYRRDSDYGRDRDLDYRQRDRNIFRSENNSRNDSYKPENRSYENRNYDRKSDFGQNSSGHRWKDTYKAGNNDGKFGQTAYPVQSRTQSGTFEQHDYTKTNFKKECGITKLPKESSTPIIKEPQYGLKWNDEESDENEESAQQPKYYNMKAGGSFHDDDDVNSFQDPNKKKKRRRRRGRSKTPEGELTDYEKRRKEMRDKKRDEWEAVKKLPKGSGKIDPDAEKSGDEEDGSFSGFSGKAKWGKRHAKRRAKVAHIPIAPVMFQKAAGVLGDAVLEEKKVDKVFEEMSHFEKVKKIGEMEEKLKQDEYSYNMWSEDYLSWFKDNVTQKGYCKDQDPIEYLKSTEKEGLTKDYAMVVNASKLRQYYLTYKIVSNKKEKIEKELGKFKSKMEPKSDDT